MNTDSLNLNSMIQPLPPEGIFRENDYYCWCPCLFRDQDQRMYMVYSRWPLCTGRGGWITHSEIALATTDRPEGPYRHHKVILTGQGSGFWDECMAHNPKLMYFDDQYYLYYISSRSGPTLGHIRDSQRVGVAVADRIDGPYVHCTEPLVVPVPPLYNIAVNPTVTRTPEGRYLFIIKGDIHPKQPHETMPQRIQAVGIADSPTGPVRVLPEPAIRDIDTEDASVWYDAERQRFYAVFHANRYIGMITSEDGFCWQRANHYIVTEKDIIMTDGTHILPERLERPGVYMEDGIPRMLYAACAIGNDWHNLLIPLKQS